MSPVTQLPLFEPEPDPPPPRRASGASGSLEFDRLKAHLEQDRAVRNEVRDALFALTEEINVTDRGSRFIAGGAIEWILAAACWSAGVIVLPEGHNADGYDLAAVRSELRGLFSIKSSLSRISDFRISNGMHGSGRGFVEPTIFLHPRLGGLVFADPALHADLASAARETGDAVVLSLAAVGRHAAAHPECLIELEVPANQGRGEYDAALEYAKGLILGRNYRNLRRVFDDVTRAGSTPAQEIERLRALRDDGTLTPAQFELALDRLLRG